MVAAESQIALIVDLIRFLIFKFYIVFGKYCGKAVIIIIINVILLAAPTDALKIIKHYPCVFGLF